MTTRAFTSAQVDEVAPGMILSLPVARQYRTMVLLAKIDQGTVTPAGRYGAGWRDLQAQRLVYQAAHGDERAALVLAKLGTRIDSTMRTSVASPGTSSHGDSTRIDVLFNGHSPSTGQIAFMAAHEWRHEFGDDDRNHFQWVGTMSGAVKGRDKNRVVAAWLNSQRLGRSTGTVDRGAWAAQSTMSWLLQTQGHEDGLYPTSRYKIDGVAGARTVWLRNHYFEALL